MSKFMPAVPGFKFKRDVDFADEFDVIGRVLGRKLYFLIYRLRRLRTAQAKVLDELQNDYKIDRVKVIREVDRLRGDSDNDIDGLANIESQAAE